MTLNVTEKRIIFQILVLIMKADEIMRQEEIDFLDKIFNEFELSIIEFDHMDDIDIEYLKKEYSVFCQDKKEYAHKLFLEMANCDGYVDPRETSIVKLFN